MKYNEQQINNSLKYIQEQEELNQIKWELQKTTRKRKDNDICEWVISPKEKRYEKTRSVCSYLKGRSKEKEKRYTYLLQLLNQTNDRNFYKYDKNKHYHAEKSSMPLVSPKRIDLKLPLPPIRQQQENVQIYQRETSLPLIKKMANSTKISPPKQRYKDKHKQLQANLQWIRQNSEFLGRRSQLELDESSRKSKMLNTRRQIKNYHSFIEKPNRIISIDDSKLKECITFIK